MYRAQEAAVPLPYTKRGNLPASGYTTTTGVKGAPVYVHYNALPCKHTAGHISKHKALVYR